MHKAMFWFALASLAFGRPACAQDAGFPTSMPKTFIECEGPYSSTSSGPCNGLWTFNGLHGEAQWPKTGTSAALSVVKFDAEQIVIKRSDTSNPGFTARYVGVLNGDTMNGTVTWAWPGHWTNPKSGVWHATVDTSLILPTIEAQNTPGTTRHFNLNGTWLSSNPAWLGGAVGPTLHIVQNGDEVQLTAVDTATGFETMHYAAHYRGDTLIGRLLATTDDADSAVTGAPATPTWQNLPLKIDNPDAISVPDGYIYRSSEPSPDDARCDESNTSRTSPQYAYMRGRSAFHERQDYAVAACWFHAAAMRGDAHSQAILALMFAQGYPGLPRSDAQAYRWAKQSAGENDYDGEMALSMLYRNGRGTSRDVAAANLWANKARKEYESDPKLQSTHTSQNTVNVGGMLIGAMAIGVLFGAFL